MITYSDKHYLQVVESYQHKEILTYLLQVLAVGIMNIFLIKDITHSYHIRRN